MITSPFVIDQAFEATESHKILKAFTRIGRVCLDKVMLIVWIKQPWKQLAVVDIGRRNCITADESMVDIDADPVLVAVVIDGVLLCPASI